MVKLITVYPLFQKSLYKELLIDLNTQFLKVGTLNTLTSYEKMSNVYIIMEISYEKYHILKKEDTLEILAGAP